VSRWLSKDKLTCKQRTLDKLAHRALTTDWDSIKETPYLVIFWTREVKMSRV
jgi:hypothetical protein